MIGARIPLDDEGRPTRWPENPGEYVGPTQHVPGSDDARIEWSMWFLLPVARDDGVDPAARSMCRVAFPPHTFRECDDGSLEVRASIGVYGIAPADGSAPVHVWHGFLDEGHRWREC